MKTTDILLVFITAALMAFAYTISKDIHDRRVQPIVPESPTAIAEYQLVPNPTFTSSYETPAYEAPTIDLTATDFFGWQTAQVDRSTGRVGEGTPTPEIGSRDMSADQHARSAAAP